MAVMPNNMLHVESQTIVGYEIDKRRKNLSHYIFTGL